MNGAVPPTGTDSWAEANRRLLEVTYDCYADTGEWPRIETLEHHFEVSGEEIDPGRLAWEIPRPLGFVEQGRLVLLCRALLIVDAARPLLEDWFKTVCYAYRSWREAPDEELISHEVVTLLGDDQVRARRVSGLLFRESWMFGSGTGDASGYWTRQIVSAVRIARDAGDAAELIVARARQEAGGRGASTTAEESLPAVAAQPVETAGDRTPGEVARPERVGRVWRLVSENQIAAIVIGGLILAGVLAVINHATGLIHLGDTSSPSSTVTTGGRAGASGGASTAQKTGKSSPKNPKSTTRRGHSSWSPEASLDSGATCANFEDSSLRVHGRRLSIGSVGGIGGGPGVELRLLPDGHFSQLIRASPGDELEVSTSLSNGAYGSAEGVSVSASIDADRGRCWRITVTAKTASSEYPSLLGPAIVLLKTRGRAELRYIPGSTELMEESGRVLPGDLPDGVAEGRLALPYSVPGGTVYYLDFRVKLMPRPLRPA